MKGRTKTVIKAIGIKLGNIYRKHYYTKLIATFT